MESAKELKGFDKRIIFFSLENTHNSRTKTYFDGIKAGGFDCEWFEISSKSIITSLLAVISALPKQNLYFVVASPSHILVPFVFILTRKKPIFDAGWPLIDGVITSRKNWGLFGLGFVKILLIDLMSIIFAKKVFVETIEQKNRLGKFYFLFRNKFLVIPTGFNESRFSFKNNNFMNQSDNNVLFRGGDLQESGIDTLINAIKISNSKKIGFIVASRSSRLRSLNLFNTLVYSDYLADEEIYKLYIKSKIILGQLSPHKRTNWTIPHKFFEAAYLGIPYVTSDSLPMLKFEDVNSVKTFKGGDPADLLEVIEKLLNDPDEMKVLGTNIKNLYELNFRQSVLSENFLKHVLNTENK